MFGNAQNLFEVNYYASTFIKDIRASYAIEDIYRRLQTMQAIT